MQRTALSELLQVFRSCPLAYSRRTSLTSTNTASRPGAGQLIGAAQFHTTSSSSYPTDREYLPGEVPEGTPGSDSAEEPGKHVEVGGASKEEDLPQGQEDGSAKRSPGHKLPPGPHPDRGNEKPEEGRKPDLPDDLTQENIKPEGDGGDVMKPAGNSADTDSNRQAGMGQAPDAPPSPQYEKK
ncbi:hypothetical protein WJX74_007854 [Apatococcus lobatus]|uniref:Uncharacterized protein n=2 Tax=Apatococcus TaxID=904362 RepID=A0AAW1SQ35_9CHLO